MSCLDVFEPLNVLHGRGIEDKALIEYHDLRAPFAYVTWKWQGKIIDMNKQTKLTTPSIDAFFEEEKKGALMFPYNKTTTKNCNVLKFGLFDGVASIYQPCSDPCIPSFLHLIKLPFSFGLRGAGIRAV